MNIWKQEQELKPETHDPNEEKEWGKPSYLDRLQALDDIIQYTPINERASSVACDSLPEHTLVMQQIFPGWENKFGRRYP